MSAQAPDPLATGSSPQGSWTEGVSASAGSCQRLAPVSGRYEGEMTGPNPGRYLLDLRVDIDPRYPNSPVLDRISGDLYQLFRFRWPFGGRPLSWRIYRESWIVESPLVQWSACQVEVTGRVRYYKGNHPITELHLVIPWRTAQPIGPAEVTFREVGGSSAAFKCDKRSNAFRELRLEVDVCASVNAPPILPAYDTHAHPVRPHDLPQRTLTIEEAYREAGVEVTIEPQHSLIDDSAAEFASWTPAELHDAMEQHFSQIRGGWPKWNLWCLLASTFEDPLVGGIMFDASATYGGAGRAPERQGCAIFRQHPWFAALTAGDAPATAQAEAQRKYLDTLVHEMGHAFNFLHSWNKGRPDALSWMNYDWRYDNRNGPESYWSNFRFRFDDEELLHLRHGDRAAVIMGGDPWASGGHLEAPVGALSELQGEAPVELLLRSKGYFQFMEPVAVELRIKNIADLPLELDTQLAPEFGGVVLYIRRPDGRVLEYAPVMCQLATPKLEVLQPEGRSVEGEDRRSQNVLLSFGADGYYFDEPGEYLVRAMYQGPGDLLIPSNILRVRLGQPFSQEEERLAQDYYSYETGLALYLQGSPSPFLQKGRDTLRAVNERFPQTPLGAQLSLILAQGLARPFFRVQEGALVKAQEADPKTALELTAQALAQHKRDETTFPNLTYHALRRTRANLLAQVGEVEEAKKELNTLVRYLKGRGVNPPVLEEIQQYARTLGATA